MLEFLLVSNNLDSHSFSRLMINAFQSLTKGPLAEKIYDLKPIGNMILQHHIIVSSFVVISIIIGEIPVAFDLF